MHVYNIGMRVDFFFFFFSIGMRVDRIIERSLYGLGYSKNNFASLNYPM